MNQRHGIELAARAGYAARGVVYLLVGGFAIDAALGAGGQARGSERALSSMVGETYGTALLAAVAVGLFGYALWRFLQAVFDVDGHGTDAKGLAVRGGLLVSAATHTVLGLYAGHLALGTSGGSSGGSSNADLVATALGWPGGRWIVAGVALAIAGAGLAQCAKGWRRGFSKWMQMDAKTARWAEPVCRAGLIARGIVFLVIAGLITRAALQRNAAEAGGLAEALHTIQASPYGAVSFAAIACGLLAFGIYSIVEARYRRIDAPDARAARAARAAMT